MPVSIKIKASASANIGKEYEQEIRRLDEKPNIGGKQFEPRRLVVRLLCVSS
jgi:hypothetical protein